MKNIKKINAGNKENIDKSYISEHKKINNNDKISIRKSDKEDWRIRYYKELLNKLNKELDIENKNNLLSEEFFEPEYINVKTFIMYKEDLEKLLNYEKEIGKEGIVTLLKCMNSLFNGHCFTIENIKLNLIFREIKVNIDRTTKNYLKEKLY